MINLKNQRMEEEMENNFLTSPLFVCSSSKNKSLTQPVFRAICQEFEENMIYFNIDKVNFG